MLIICSLCDMFPCVAGGLSPCEKGDYKMRNAKVRKCEKWPKITYKTRQKVELGLEFWLRLGLGLGLD